MDAWPVTGTVDKNSQISSTILEQKGLIRGDRRKRRYIIISVALNTVIIVAFKLAKLFIPAEPVALGSHFIENTTSRLLGERHDRK